MQSNSQQYTLPAIRVTLLPMTISAETRMDQIERINAP